MDGYIFDMDGTLLDSMYVWDEVPQRYMEKKGLKPVSNMAKMLAHMSLTQTALYLQEHFGICDDIDTIIEDVNACVAYQYEHVVTLKAGIYDCIWSLYKKGKTVCLLTACDLHVATSALKRCGILDAFSAIMTCETLGFSKTDTALYEIAAGQMGWTKETCVFIEDSLHAIEAIKKAGYQAYAVYDKANEKEWSLICKCSDAAFQHIKEMEI